MSKFTKGPWVSDHPLDMEGMRHIYVKDSGSHIICRVDGHFGGISCGKTGEPDEHNTTANARLIAAAPDLYEACKRAIDNVEHGDDDGWIEAIEAAVAKANPSS